MFVNHGYLCVVLVVCRCGVTQATILKKLTTFHRFNTIYCGSKQLTIA